MLHSIETQIFFLISNYATFRIFSINFPDSVIFLSTQREKLSSKRDARVKKLLFIYVYISNTKDLAGIYFFFQQISLLFPIF